MFWRRQDEDEEWNSEDNAWPITECDDEGESRPKGLRRRFLLMAGVLALVGLVLWQLWGEGSASPSTTLETNYTVTTPTLVPSPTELIGVLIPDVYDPDMLASQMLSLINADRASSGLAPVAWDATAAQAGAIHAADMVEKGYFSHWSTEGLGPDHRYALNGGEHAVMENLHALVYAYEDGRGGAPIEDWASVIEQAQAGLMLSPGHRANILDPAHTHVGIGMAYDPSSGEFRLAQEFTNHYATLSIPPPVEAVAGSAIRVAGSFDDGPLTNFILSLAYEPWPAPMTPDELNRTNTYRSAAESRDGRLVDRIFDETLTLGESGLYHVRLFIDSPTGQALVVNRLVAVR